jgi:iron(III) transport system ATP-binding protein
MGSGRWDECPGYDRSVSEGAAAPAIAAVEVTKRFGSTVAVDEASVTVDHGQVVALLGPSGSGKTTLLRAIAGFEVPDAGRVEVGGRAVAGPDVWVEPEDRRVGMVFQDGALFPHLTVAGNVRFGRHREHRPDECLELVGLAHRAGSYPHELSGGERQRVALARALATDPEVVLLDEPFASLDAGLRTALREEVIAILRAAGASALLVTHDQQEALSLADTVALMRAGRIVQIGSPEEVYVAPATRWAAEFLGAVDVIHAIAADGVVTCELGGLAVGAGVAGPVDVLVRPESVAIGPPLAATGPSDGGGNGRVRVAATVVGRSFFGSEQVIRLELASGLRLSSRRPSYVSWRVGDPVSVWIEGPVTAVACEHR